MTERLEERVERLEKELAALRGARYRGVRKRSEVTILGLPAYDIALGPDLEKGELRGHARGFVALGDIATGVFAVGGLARGVVAFGGLAVGLVSLGGASIGLLLAVGGFALGSVALGGGAVGGVAIGGGAAGHFACGGGAVGTYVIEQSRRDPEAEAFFREWGGLCPASRLTTGRRGL